MEEEAVPESEEIADLSYLPEGAIANILSLTTPSDACRSSVVSQIFNAAAQSDIVWDRFLPADLDVLISRRAAVDLSFDPILSSKKEIFFSICNNPILIDDGNKSFSLDKWSGKKCIMLGARDLSIVWAENSYYWSWEHHPSSRFAEVAVLLDVWWLEIRGRISCTLLSPSTTYAAYFVFQMGDVKYGFDIDYANAMVGTSGTENHPKSVCLDPHLENRQQYQRHPHGSRLMSHPDGNMSGLDRPKERDDGWFEIELGEFRSGDGDDEVEMSLMEVKGNSAKSGLIVEGIEIRPKHIPVV